MEVSRVPFDGVLGPCTLKTGGDGVFPFPSSIRIGPSETLLFNGGSLWVNTNMRVLSCAMGFPESMTSCYQSNCFLVIHGHSAESDPDVMCRCTRVVQYSAGSLRVDLDQAHLHCTQFGFE